MELINRQEAVDERNSLDNPDEYIILKGKAALIAKILLELAERRTTI